MDVLVQHFIRLLLVSLLALGGSRLMKGKSLKKKIFIACMSLASLALLACGGSRELERQYLQRNMFSDTPVDSGFNFNLAEDPLSPLAPPNSFIEQAHGFSYGLAAVKIKGRWGYVDTTGRLVIPPLFLKAGDFMEGSAVVLLENRLKYGLISRRGRYLAQPLFDAISDVNNGIGWVVFGQNEYIVDIQSKQIIVPEFQPDEMHQFSADLTGVEKNGKWGFLDSQGKVAIPCRYQAVSLFNEGLCAVRINERWGYIDNEDKTVLEPLYLSGSDFSEGLVVVDVALPVRNTENSQVIIDKEGNGIGKRKFYDASTTVDGITPVAVSYIESDTLNVKWLYWRPREDIFVTGMRFDAAYPFSEGLASIEIGQKWGFVDTTSMVITGMAYDTVTVFRDGRALVKDSSGWNMIDREGNRVGCLGKH